MARKHPFSLGIAHLSVILSALCWPLVGQAQIERQHDAHVHGQATGTLAMDETRWELTLALPGFNVVGFEHPPRTPEQSALLSDALDYFNQQPWLGFNPESGCQITDTDVQSMGFEDPQDNHQHHHDHGSDHDGHARMEIKVSGECDRMDALTRLSMKLFDAFPNNEQVMIAVLTTTRAMTVTLTPQASSIVFN